MCQLCVAVSQGEGVGGPGATGGCASPPAPAVSSAGWVLWLAVACYYCCGSRWGLPVVRTRQKKVEWVGCLLLSTMACCVGTRAVQVCAVTQGGAFAEEVVVPAAAAWHIPAGVDAAEAAGVPIVYGTADLALRHRARLREGQTVLVLGASGGVGTAAVQISKLLGARVVAVTSGADKAAYLRQLGADAVVDTAAPAAAGQRLHKLIAAAAPKSVDVVFDPVGGQALFESLKCVAWGAQYLVIGFAAGDIPKVPANLLLVKNTTMHGVFWGSYMAKDYAVLAGGLRQVLDWAGQGRLALQVSHRFQLHQLPQAMAALLGRQVRGKVILTMDSSSSSSRQGSGPVSKL
ncbi:hypothetical protein COO60DRAFT_838483 [Scenedesmus sp. NREL 46B-D3]|nr:hypothetical protein COO60DRAFT_838483 [Scenedesmus sp. NREL 46B-D3]